MFISYDYYRIFYYVAKYGNFTQAAEALMNNQPNITRTIKNLESELGCTLFVRSNRGVTLTPEGERLYVHISAAMEHIQAGEEEISLERTLQKGLVTIGASEIALRCFLIPVLKSFRQKHPGVRLKVFNHSTPQALSALKSGLIDIAVVTTPLGDMSGLSCSEIKKVRETAVCGAAFPELIGRKVALSELKDYPIISLGEKTKTYEMYSEWFSENGCKFSPDIEAATADQILPMVMNELGIGFVPEEFLEEYNANQTIKQITLQNEIPQRSICLVKRTAQTLNIAAKKLQSMILTGTALL
ncbi:MAG: LysR family transcriptional regulator [Lachnospiraceae bacterium]